MTFNLRSLLEEMIQRDASDLHITAAERPKLRVDGDMSDSSVVEVLTPKDTLQLAYSVLTENQKKRFETEDELDFSFGIQNLARFRGNVFKQRGCVAMVIRMIPFNVRTFQELGLPPVIAKLAERPRGLILVTGPTGSGKSTTLAAIIDKINKERKGHIITVEDPIEFIHRHQSCIVNQREIGTDTKTFASGAEVCAPRGPGRHPGGRNAGPRDGGCRADHRGDRPPGARHPAHQFRGGVHQPRDRRLPLQPAVPGAGPARLRARGRGHPDAAAEAEGPRPVHGGRDHGRHPGHPGADSRRQGPPDLFGHAVGQEVRDADHERRAVPALHRPRGCSGRVRAGVARSQGVPPDDRDHPDGRPGDGQRRSTAAAEIRRIRR